MTDEKRRIKELEKKLRDAENERDTLKTQMVYHRRFSDRHETKIALFQYIEAYYKRRRRHSSNSWKSHAEFELNCQDNMFVA